MPDFSTAQIQQGQTNPGGAREDLTDIIYNIDPTETPILTAAGSTTARGIFHEWLTDVLDTPGLNKTDEGDEPSGSFGSGTGPVRLGNYTPISSKLVRVTGTTEVIDKAGRDSEMAYQSALRARSLKNDVDYSISAPNLARNGGGSSGSPPTGGGGERQSASLMVWLGETAVDTAGSTKPTSNDGTAAWTGLTNDGTEAFTQAKLDQAIQNCWTEGGKPTLIVAGPTQKTNLSGFDGVGNNTSTANTTRTDRMGRTIYATMDVYVSNFGTLNVVPSRHIRSTGGVNDGYPGPTTTPQSIDTKVFCIDPEYLKVAYLRPWQQFDLAKVGDSIRREMLVEWTLQVSNQKAHSVIVDLQA